MRAKEYTIVTEDINMPFIHKALADCGISGYSIIEHDGCYDNHLERGLSIVIVDNGEQYSQELLESVCETVKIINKQEHVYLEIRYLDFVVI
jgi:hypothetical protein